MKSSVKVAFLIISMSLSSACFSQASGKSTTPSCVIVKRHAFKFGENISRLHPHRPFDYVEGNYPSGYKWRSELGDGDVRELQNKGGKIVVLDSNYQSSDLEEAKKSCQQ